MKEKVLKCCPKCDSAMFLVTTIAKNQYCTSRSGGIYGGQEDEEFRFDKVLMQLVECRDCRTLISDNLYDDDIYEEIDIPNNWTDRCPGHRYDPEMCSRCAGE
jgi:hypothetical protein